MIYLFDYAIPPMDKNLLLNCTMLNEDKQKKKQTEIFGK